MGLDTAYIPAKKQDIDFFVGDVIREPDLLDSRIQLITQSKKDREFLRQSVYANILSENEEQYFDKCLGYSACSILTYLHPYYYDRGRSLMDMLSNEGGLPQSISVLFDDFSLCFPNVKHSGDSYDINYRSGIYIKEDNVGKLFRLLSDKELWEDLNLDESSGLLSALKYAEKHGAGIVEVFDIHIPMTGEFYSSMFNLRAAYLNNLDNELAECDCVNTGFTIGIPVPSSSIITFDDLGKIIYEWMDNEYLLPMHENSPVKDKKIQGVIYMSLIYEDTTPIIIIGTKQNVFIHDADDYFEKLRLSLFECLNQHNLDINFFISTHGEGEVPEEIRSIEEAEVLYRMKPSFIFGGHEWFFIFDKQRIEMNLSLKGNLEVLLNGNKIDQYKVSLSKDHRTVYFSDGNWYTILVKNTNVFSGELDIKLHKGLFLQAHFKLLQGSKVYPKLKNLLLKLGEMLTIIFFIMIFILPRPFTMLPLLILLITMYKYNKRHHLMLIPVEGVNDSDDYE
ncbi:hypothetical protein Q9X99_001901 [Vibrio cholerae]|nr:hypothetical protein [Vibrio cholerae]